MIVAKMLKLRRGVIVTCQFQDFVEQSLVCEGIIKGIALPLNEGSPTEQLAGRPTGGAPSAG